MLGEHQPIGAGDRDMRVLERANDGFEQGPALAHQHQHVACARALLDPELDVPCDLACQAHLRARLGQLVERRVPGLDLTFARGFDRVPDLHDPRCGVGQRLVDRVDGIGGESGKGLGSSKDLVDGAEHIRAGAK